MTAIHDNFTLQVQVFGVRCDFLIFADDNFVGDKLTARVEIRLNLRTRIPLISKAELLLRYVIRELKQTDPAAEKRRSRGKFLFRRTHDQANSVGP